MSKPKLKMTGCARLFIALLIIIPIAYFSARLIRGEGIPVVDQWVENLFSSSDEMTNEDGGHTVNLRDLQRENAALKEINKVLNKELDDCRGGKESN